jgi:hypothetical protein
MIEIKPYREIQAVDNDKGKTRIGGAVTTGRMAYAWHKNSALTTSLTNYFLIGMLITILLFLITGSPVWFAPLAIVSLFGLLVISPLWKIYLNRYIGQPIMRVSSEHVARGDTLDIEFRQPFARNCAVSSVTIHLIKREWVRYKCGTDVCTDTKDVTVQRFYNRNKEQVAGGSYERRATFDIPKDAMHSLALPDNHLLWLIRVKLEVEGLMPLTETYAIQVTPEVHTL